MSIRDNLRATIFSAANTKRQGITTSFFGTTIELRQATVGQIQEMLDERNSTGNSLSLVTYLINYAYVPDTDDLVFEEGDFETLKNLPYNKDMQGIATIITKLSSIDIEGAEKNLPETDSNGAS